MAAAGYAGLKILGHGPCQIIRRSELSVFVAFLL